MKDKFPNGLAAAMKKAGIGPTELARRAETSKQNIQRLRDGERELSRDWAVRLAPHLGVRPEALVFPTSGPLVGSFDPDAPAGTEAEMAVHAGGRMHIPEGEIPQVAATLGLGHSEDAELIEVPVGHGTIAALPVLDTWKVPETILRRRLSGSLRDVHIIECEGDSMDPRIRDGDFVFIDTSRRVPSPPGIFAINDGFSQTLKRLEIIPNTDPPRVKIIPENARHESYERLLDEINIVGRYLCRLTMD